MDTNLDSAIKNFMMVASSVLYALYETPPAPESILYLACGANMARYENLKQIMVKSGLIEINNHLVTLTDKGREYAKPIVDAIESEPVKNTIGFNPLGSKPIPEC